MISVEEDYYDSSDGLSDIDDEIDDMEKKIGELKKRRDQLLESMNKKSVGLEEWTLNLFVCHVEISL